MFGFRNSSLALAISVLGVGLPAFSQTYQLRLYNVDDTLTATITNSTFSNQQILQEEYGQDSGAVDITSWVRPGSNTIHISLYNGSGGYAYAYQYFVNNMPTDSNSCGTAGVVGCNNNDQSRQSQVVYTHDISVSGSSGGGGTTTTTGTGPTATTARRTLPVDLSNSCYNHPTNPFDEGDGMQCTRFAWGRACEKLGQKLAFNGSGGLDAGEQWWTRVTGLITGQTALPNSIAVWSNGGGLHSGGHVAFVEEVANGNITLTEANFYSYPNAQYDDSHTIPLASMTNRSGLTLLGYIYPNNYQGYIDSNSNTCPSTVTGWLANWDQLNTSLNVELFDNETYLGFLYANAWRGDVAGFLHDNGNHGFSYPLPNSVLDGRQHTIWARVASIYVDLINNQYVSCNNLPSNRVGNLQLTFAPTIALPSYSSDCTGTNYQFTLSGAETNGVGINLSNLSLPVEGWSWQTPIFGIPNRINAFGNFQSGIRWCRGPGTSTWTITGTDDNGKSVTSTANITFSLQ